MVYFNRIFVEDIRNCVRLALYFTLTRDRNRFRRQFRRKCGGQFTRPFRRKFPSGAAFFRRFPGYTVPGKPRITVCLIVPCCQIFCRVVCRDCRSFFIVGRLVLGVAVFTGRRLFALCRAFLQRTALLRRAFFRAAAFRRAFPITFRRAAALGGTFCQYILHVV